MSKRFFVGDPLDESTGAMVKLGDQESHHLISVMRAKVQDAIVLFNGDGYEYDARVQKLDKRAVQVEVFARREVQREPSARLEIGVALPKGDRQQWLCEKLVELGCYRLTPLYTERGVAEPGEAALARLRRYVIEASKQCGRNRLMEIGEPRKINEFLSTSLELGRRLFLDASGGMLKLDGDSAKQGKWIAAIGPEGGWTDQEIAAARANSWELAGLGSRILRVETAAAALCSRICVD